MELVKFRTLRPLSTKPKASRDFFVFDTETGTIDRDGNIKYQFGARPEKLLFGVVYSENYCKVLQTPKDFQNEFLHSRYKNKTVYAHNAEYDLTAVYDNIYKFDPDAIFNGKFICASNGVCTFADSYNLLQGSVKEIGAMLGLNKEQLGDQNLISHVSRLHKDVHYCRRDCEIVYIALKRMFENCEPKLTIGSLSLTMFRRNFLVEPIRVNPELCDLFFMAYYGGRTEVFRKGKCYADVFDINSAYPYAGVMAKLPDPQNLERTFDSNKIMQIINDESFEGMITATVLYPACHIPILPIHYDDKLIFPTGKFSGAWTLIEFRYAIKTHKIKIVELGFAVYSRGIESPIKEFMLHYYNERQKSNDLFHRYTLKLFMNNLTGKFAQRIKSKSVYVENPKDIGKQMQLRKIDECEIIEVNDGCFIQYEIPERVVKHSIACFAAYITAFTRIHLHKFMNQKPHVILYCDTDSIFAESFAPKNLSDKLGGWKKENYKVTRIHAPKDYEVQKELLADDTLKLFKRTKKIKGVKKGSRQISDNVFEVLRMIKTKESFKLKDKIPAGTFKKMNKVLTRNYTKRKVKKSGETIAIQL